MHFIKDIESRLSSYQIITNEEDKKSFEKDWRGRYQGSSLAVVFPKTVDEVIWIVQCCIKHHIKIVPQSGNTSLCGGSVPITSIPSVVINLSKLNQIREIDLDNNTIIVESGVILEQLSKEALNNNRLFPLSMASEGSAQIGGIISTNAGGTAVIRYGTMRGLVLGLEVILPSGELWHGLTGLRKDNTGYDLKQLFIGAEGTLGIITAATLKLLPLPKTKEIYWVTTNNIQNTVSILTHLKKSVGDQICAFEIISSNCLQLIKKHFPQLVVPHYEEGNWIILVELDYFNEPQENHSIFMDCIEKGIINDVVLAVSEQQKKHFWSIREHIPLAEKNEGFSIKHDISLPISSIPQFVINAVNKVNQLIPGVGNICFGHLGDGNLHFNFTNPGHMMNEEFLSLTSTVNEIVYDLVYQYHGSLSAEHGIGQLKINSLKKYKSELEMDLMLKIKQTIDPMNIMNPGKLLSISDEPIKT
ncbi:FAD-binding oxidoreductase [Ferrovum sp. PN-J185]|uniref:FAD-binding oxidoreductase n=1 Tax=Ferrovum sp. PN-J185 TaxID=1356306 RepID=UPI001E47CDB3|nr:FAD-binding oxidoreductase [Ferrovum sp. PN-J185]MCC6068209.1 FAD-binding oxidoreductase [Ferrovum sp. PN-J185]MDE1891315.1 FAD-binding oxidoreductase [Betaproteobacteria bacterium]MDE2056159.1 FAD-binding oxidoreductase [Betaproteobacteria bacterium]